MQLLYRKNSAFISGYYDETADIIYISDGLSPLVAECVYLHERQHQICFRKGCKCYDTINDDLTEYHAFKGELMAVLDRGSPALARAYLRSMKNIKAKIAADPTLWDCHKRAVARVERLAAYRRVTKLAESTR